MTRATTVLVLAPVLSLGMVLFGPEQEEAHSREGKEAHPVTLVCTANPCFDLGGSTRCWAPTTTSRYMPCKAATG